MTKRGYEFSNACRCDYYSLQLPSYIFEKLQEFQSSHCDSVVTNPTRIHEDEGSIPSLTQWVKDLALLGLRCWLAAAAPIGPLAWELPYAAGAALKSKNKTKQKKQNLSI